MFRACRGTDDNENDHNEEEVDQIVATMVAAVAVAENDGEEKEKEEGVEGEEEEEELGSEKEELDYDEEEEDEERRERTSRYTSEKKGRATLESTEGGDENESKKDGKEQENTKRDGIPSLFDKTITNNPMYKIFYPRELYDAAPQNIVPRLPNGIPLVAQPSSHGRAGFGQGYQAQARITGGGGGVPVGGHWDQAVAMFLNGANPAAKSSRGSRTHRKRRNSSYSSASSDSSDSRSRSRSSSRGGDRRRRDRKEPRRERDHRDKRDDRRDDRRDRRRQDDRRPRQDYHNREDRERDSRRRKEQSKNATIESAKALGLSVEYMDRVNDQKRKREEIVRKKEERRHGLERKESAHSTHHEHQESSSAQAPSKEKTKAFLAVNVSGVQHLTTAVKRIEALATELGQIKKCWRSADDVVSLIFNAHDKAKDFMIKYNGKVLSGMRIVVALEKKFLNLNEVN
uniref:Uncharacterized protein n=1 Tax=Caenorhabditis japonica TaxID=281687 RepID=A0A8R1DLW1_CAEJA